MQIGKIDNQENLVHTSIKTREVIYYLVTEQDLNDIKAKGIIGDIFMLLASIVLGGFISSLLINLTGVDLDAKTTGIINLMLYLFLILGVLFLGFVIFYLYQNYYFIIKIKQSGAIKSYSSLEDASKIESNESYDDTLRMEHLLFSIYYTDQKSLNVTKQIREMFKNKQDIIATNEIAGDPEYGVPKKLLIRYLFKGVVIDKVFEENEKVQLP